MALRLLTAFRQLFEGQPYRHRNSSLGDRVAVEVYEDLFALGQSAKFVASVQRRVRGVGPSNRAVSPKRIRRGDGTFGRLVDADAAHCVPGYAVPRGALATIDCGVEVKILNKAMIKQIDRVINDLEKQVIGWKSQFPRVVSVAVIGINHAAYAVGYEGDRSFRTDGRVHKHPFQEAEEAYARIVRRVIDPRLYDETLVLQYVATNDAPFSFAWRNAGATTTQYQAALVRLSAELDRRL